MTRPVLDPTATHPPSLLDSITPPPLIPSSLHLPTTSLCATSQTSTSAPSLPPNTLRYFPLEEKDSAVAVPPLPDLSSATIPPTPLPEMEWERIETAPRRPATARRLPSGEKVCLDNSLGASPSREATEPNRLRGERKHFCDERSYV